VEINKQYISEKNTYPGKNAPKYIVVHETDNFNTGSGAKRHAEAQYNGHLSQMSAHYYCGSDGIYQAANHEDGTWSIGKDYGGNHSITDASNINSINVEICVNADGDYVVARNNAIALVKEVMKITGIPAERVIRHFDAKGKYCPRTMMNAPALWEEFKRQISQSVAVEEEEKTETHVSGKMYRVRLAWDAPNSQKGAFEKLQNAINMCNDNPGYSVYDESGIKVYPEEIAPVQTEYPENFDKNMAGEYTVTAEDYLVLRRGAGTDHEEILRMPPNAKAKCYGCFTQAGKTTWLLVVYEGEVGYASKVYLEKK